MMQLIEEISRFTGKRTVKNGIWMYLLQFFNAVVPILTLPYITRVLGSAGYGVFSIAFNIVSYMQVMVEYGFGMSATRKVALADKEDINELFSTVICARSILLGICGVITTFVVLINKENIELCSSLLVLMICLFGYCIQMNWMFQGKQKMRYISIVNIISRFISVICIFAFVKYPSDLLLYCLFYSASPLLSGCIGLKVAIKKYELQFVKISLKKIKDELMGGWYVFTTQLSSKVFGSIGITFLGIFASSSEVGVFSAIQKIPNILMLAWTPISQVLYPVSSVHMKNNFEDGKKFVYKMRKIFLPIYALLAFGVCVFSRFAIEIIYGNGYSNYYYWTFPLLIWMVIAINNNFLGIQLLLGGGFDKEYSQCFQISVLSTIFLNFLLIYFAKGNGAALAPMLSELVLYCMLIINIRKISKVK